MAAAVVNTTTTTMSNLMLATMALAHITTLTMTVVVRPFAVGADEGDEKFTRLARLHNIGAQIQHQSTIANFRGGGGARAPTSLARGRTHEPARASQWSRLVVQKNPRVSVQAWKHFATLLPVLHTMGKSGGLAGGWGHPRPTCAGAAGLPPSLVPVRAATTRQRQPTTPLSKRRRVSRRRPTVRPKL